MMLAARSDTGGTASVRWRPCVNEGKAGMNSFKCCFEIAVDLGNGPIPVEGGGRSMQYQRLRECLFRSDETNLSTLHIPPFNRGNAVPDATAGTWDGTRPDFFIEPVSVTQRKVRTGCIGLVVESPHKDEFVGPDFTPLWPLNNKNTKQGIRNHFKRLIREAEATYGLAAPEADVVYINPVPFQASLARYMQNPNGGMLDTVRDQVWKALFGLPAVRDDFFSRLAAYRPAFLFIATTSNLKPIVLDALESYRADAGIGGSPCLVLDRHPSVWLRKCPSIVSCER
jgi:hypothetical protein